MLSDLGENEYQGCESGCVGTGRLRMNACRSAAPIVDAATQTERGRPVADQIQQEGIADA